MKQWGRLLLLAALTSAGCFGPGAGGHADLARLAKEDANKTLPAPPPPDIKPSDVNETNFHEKLKQVEAEIEREETSKSQ